MKKRNYIKTALKFTAKLMLIVVGMVIFYLLASFLLSNVVVNNDEIKDNDIAIYLSSNGVHTDIIVPLRSEEKNWLETVSPLHSKGQDTTANFAQFGWGDKGFFLNTPTWADLKFSTAINAAFFRSTSALHVTFHQAVAESSNCFKINLSNEEYRELVKYIEKSFELDANHKSMPIPTNAVYGTNDVFYEATGTYSLFNTCNTWTNRALKKCGQKASLWTPFEFGVMRPYREEREQALLKSNL